MSRCDAAAIAPRSVWPGNWVLDGDASARIRRPPEMTTAFLARTDQLRRVAWRNELRGGQPTKVPYGRGALCTDASGPAGRTDPLPDNMS